MLETQLSDLTLTVLSGVVVYILSQWYTEFILRPIQEYKQLKAKVAKLLIMHARYYSNPRFYDNAGDYPEWTVASDEIRELAAEVAAFAEIKPQQFLVLWAIPSKKKLFVAYKYLIGISNAFFTSRNSEERSVDRIYDYPDIIRKNMGISYRRAKV